VLPGGAASPLLKLLKDTTLETMRAIAPRSLLSDELRAEGVTIPLGWDVGGEHQKAENTGYYYRT